MSYGKILASRTFLLAALTASIGGCDSGASSSRVPVAAQHRAWSLSDGGVTVQDRAAPGKAVDYTKSYDPAGGRLDGVRIGVARAKIFGGSPAADAVTELVSPGSDGPCTM